MSCFYIGDSIPGSNVTAASVLVVVSLFFYSPFLEFALVHSPSDQCLRLVQSWSAMHRFHSNSLRCSWLTTGFHLTGRVYAHFLWCVLIIFLPQCRRITITRLWFAHLVSTRFRFLPRFHAARQQCLLTLESRILIVIVPRFFFPVFVFFRFRFSFASVFLRSSAGVGVLGMFFENSHWVAK